MEGITPHGSNRRVSACDGREARANAARLSERELEWVRMAPKARHAKSKARLGAYENYLAKMDDRRKRGSRYLYPNGPRLGNKVIEFQGVSKAYGDKILFDNLS